MLAKDARAAGGRSGRDGEPHQDTSGVAQRVLDRGGGLPEDGEGRRPDQARGERAAAAAPAGAGQQQQQRQLAGGRPLGGSGCGGTTERGRVEGDAALPSGAQLQAVLAARRALYEGPEAPAACVAGPDRDAHVSWTSALPWWPAPT